MEEEGGRYTERASKGSDRVDSDQIRSVVGGIGDADGEWVGCGKRRIVSRIKWYPSLSVSSPFLSSSSPLFAALDELASARLFLSVFRFRINFVSRMYDFDCYNSRIPMYMYTYVYSHS